MDKAEARALLNDGGYWREAPGAMSSCRLDENSVLIFGLFDDAGKALKIRGDRDQIDLLTEMCLERGLI